MRKKFTMLLALTLCALTSSVMAQTYYRPGDRTTTLEAGKKYFISAATYYGGTARTNLLYNNGGTLAYSNIVPNVRMSDEAYLFTVEEVGENNVYYIKNNEGKYLQSDNLASTETKTGITVALYNSVKGVATCGDDVNACDENGDIINYGDITDQTPIVCVYSDNNNGWRHINGVQIGKSTPFAFYEVEEEKLALPELSTVGNIKYYAIKNIRCGEYAVYAGDQKSIQLQPYCGDAGKFYFTGEKSADGTLLTVKIHNATTEKLCSGVASWNEDGCDWYIQVSGNTAKPGFAISSANDLANDTYSWNNAGGFNTHVAVWNGNDLGSTWEFVSVESADLREIPQMSTTEAPILYHIQNARQNGKNANYVAAGQQVAQSANVELGSYWYFVADAEATVQDGWTACKIYNAANAKSIKDQNAGTFDNQTYFIKKYEHSGLVGFAIKRSIGENAENTQDAWNDKNGTGVTNYWYYDAGSIWWFEKAAKTVEQLKQEAATAIANAKKIVGYYDYADYYSCSDENAAAAKSAINGLNADNLVNAVSGHMTANKTLKDLKETEKSANAPVAGDIIQLKNKQYGKYLKANDENLGVVEDGTDLATLWILEAGEGTGVKLKNISTEKYIGEITTSNPVAMVENTTAKEFTWTNQVEIYAVFKETDGEGYEYGHIAGGGQLVGWEPGADASQWVVSKISVDDYVKSLQDAVAYAELAVGGNVGQKTVETTVYDEAKAVAEAALAAEQKSIKALYTAELGLLDVVEKGTVNLPVAGKYYQIRSANPAFVQNQEVEMAMFSRNDNLLAWKAVDNADKSFYWTITPTNDNKFTIQNAADNKYVPVIANDMFTMTADGTSADKFTLTWLAPGQFNINGTGSTMHAANHISGTGTEGRICSWGGSIDSPSAWNIVESELPTTTYTVTYKFNYNGETKYTQELTVKAGDVYPAMNVSLPYGVTSDFELPEGEVNADVELEFALTMNLPFEVEAEDEETPTWYYAQMHAMHKLYIFANESNLVWSGKEDLTASKVIADANLDNYLWRFVGDQWTGFKMVNKAGQAICSTGDGEVTVVDELADATALFVSNSKANGEWFCLKSGNNYLNLDYNKSVITHYYNNDNGSSFFLTEYNKTYEVEVGDAGYATYYSQYRLAIPETVEAYVVSEVSGRYAILEQVTGVLPDNTGVILKGVGTHTFTTSAAAPATNATKNELKGSVADEEVSGDAYILANVNDVVGLYKVELTDGKFTNNANKAYLPASAVPAGAPMLRISRGETGIEALGAQPAIEAIYDLTGRRVEKMEKGIYIVNGRKVIVK